jgi:dTMP kinase
MRGLFITFEGTEGGGKSTQIAQLAQHLRALGYHVRPVREPGGTTLGEEIRHILKHSAAGTAMTPETELLLLNASRAQLVREVLLPALHSGEVVLCDRFFDSTMAYQSYGRGLPTELVQNVIEVATAGLKPDLTLLLRVPVAVSEARRAARGSVERDRFEESDRSFFERVEAGFDALAAAEPARIKVVDASRSIEAVAADIRQIVEQLIHTRSAPPVHAS